MCERIWLTRLLGELKIPIENPMRLYCDNKATMSIAHNPMHHERTKHVKIDRHFIKEKIDNGSICTTYLLTKQQVVDIFTKSPPKPSFEELINKWGMINILAPV